MTSRLTDKAVALVCGALILGWAVSLALKVVTAPSANEPGAVFYGSTLLLIGIFGALDGQFAWFANLTFGLMLFRTLSYDDAPKFHVIALALIHGMFVANMLWWSSWPANAASHDYVITQHHAGFYLWLAVMVLMPFLYLAAARRGSGSRASDD